MILDAEERAEDWFRDRIFDVCVIGAGPAGITLARRLAARGWSVGLFEAGGLELTSQSQELYQGTIAGQGYYPLDGCRLRFFGGSSNHWGGWCRPLDSSDFEANPANPGSGWPIKRTDLDAYSAEADDILDLPANFDPPDIFAGEVGEFAPRFFRFSRPITRFGEKYRTEIEASETLRVYLNANLVDIGLAPDLRSASTAVFRSYRRDETFAVKARFFALCLGGLETPRMLLSANAQVAAGIGNEHDLVGRFFMEHPHAPVGKAVMRDPLTSMLVYSPSANFKAANHILNFGLRIGNFDLWNSMEFSGAFTEQPACTLGFDALLAAEINGEKTACPAHVGDVFVACEQSLDRENRVKLSAMRDRFGLRKIELDWRLSDLDLRTLRTAAVEAAKLIADRDVGRMKVVDWLLNEQPPALEQVWGGNHHMGTTRMSDDPHQGVVDRTARIHSLENLYVGGSSVFATSGHANPTYTIVQLALRLGDHLDARLGHP